MTGTAPSDRAGSPRPVASDPRRRTASLTSTSQRGQRRGSTATEGWSQPALAQHINKPLRRRRWASRNRVWTRHAIDRERTDFFDTRVTGRAEIWQTLHAALEVLWEADATTNEQRSAVASAEEAETADAAADLAEALATAQSMIDAADITLPTGDLAQGAYDAFGSFYALPAWIVSDPTNMDKDPAHDPEDFKGVLGVDADEDDDDDLSDDLSENDENDENGDSDQGEGTRVRQSSLRSRRAEKGKAVAVVQDQIAVRARLSATSRDVVVYLGRNDTVRSLVHRILEEGKLPHKTRIRIAYLGKILKDGLPLAAQGWKDGHVVNALVFEPA